MAFKPGHKKAGGRTVGTPNRATFDLIQTLREMGFDPAAALVKAHLEAVKQYEATEEVVAIINEEKEEYTDAETPRVYVRREIRGRSADYLKVVASTAAELMQYTYPKRKATDKPLDDGNRDASGAMKQVVLYVPSNGR